MGSNPTFGSIAHLRNTRSGLHVAAPMGRIHAKRRAIRWKDVAIVTFGMGLAFAVSWVAFFRQVDSYSLDLPAMLRPGRLQVYATQFLLVGALLVWLARGPIRDRSFGALAATAVAAWVGEGIASPSSARRSWRTSWIRRSPGTPGSWRPRDPAQPMVAIVGGWTGIRARPPGASG
ncbi:MAG TPA: hypothetical protein VF365_06795 [Candidatus Limnocylindria bacterium]